MDYFKHPDKQYYHEEMFRLISPWDKRLNVDRGMKRKYIVFVKCFKYSIALQRIINVSVILPCTFIIGSPSNFKL